MKKPGYNPFSIISQGVGFVAKTIAMSNPATAPFAPAIGTTVTAVLGGVELTEEQQTIRKSIDKALDEFWEITGNKYHLTEPCLNELKSELMDKDISTDEFVTNATNKGLSKAMDTIIISILRKHRTGLEAKNHLNVDPQMRWDYLHINENGKKISKELEDLINNVIKDNGLIMILVKIEKNRRSEMEEHERLEKKADQILDEVRKSNIPPIDATDAQTSFDFSPYYELVEKRFTSKKRGNLKKLVGEYSDEEAYIEAYLTVGFICVPVLYFLENWFCLEKSETMLIHGEPGHGKSTLCDKVVVEYIRGNFLRDKATNVITVSLNTGDNRRIISDKGVDIEAALSWDGLNKSFTFEDCRGALIFMDGFDEFIDEAKKVGITNIVSFMKRIDAIAFDYDIHIVVLSRTIAVNDYLNEQAIIEKSFRMTPIRKDQQDVWLKEHNEYNDYLETFRSIRDDYKEMSDILGIPLLFRMIVYSRFDKVTTNVIELYDRLTDHLLEKRNICEIDDKEQVVSGLRELAYNVYCNDTDTVTVPEKQWDTRWIFAFYIKQIRKRVIGFFHRSFYQYFLAKYVYFQVLDIITDKQAETFIGAFAERELDDTVRQYLSMMINDDNRETIYTSLKLVIEALVRTEANFNSEPRYYEGDAEKSKLGRTINIYRNTLHISAAFSYVIENTFKDGMSVFFRTYPSTSIKICSVENNRADLVESNLIGADLSGADLSGTILTSANLNRANLSKANLSGADLSEANLNGTDLSGADLSGADLSGAILTRANLNRANLSKANLSGADLSEANLSGGFLSGADLSGAILTRANLSKADLSGAILTRANLSSTDLRGAILTRANLSSTDLRGDVLSIDYRIGAILGGANLSGADVSWAKLSGANLSGGFLSGADLSNANLSGAKLISANLTRADLSNANLSGAKLISANLTRADLSNANLSGADLRRANLSGTKLSGAILIGAILNVKNILGAFIDTNNKKLIDPSIYGYKTIVWVKSMSKSSD